MPGFQARESSSASGDPRRSIDRAARRQWVGQLDYCIAVLVPLIGEAKALRVSAQSIWRDGIDAAHDFGMSPLDQTVSVAQRGLHLINDLPADFAERLATSLDGNIVPLIDFTVYLRKLVAQAFHLSAQERDPTNRIEFLLLALFPTPLLLKFTFAPFVVFTPALQPLWVSQRTSIPNEPIAFRAHDHSSPSAMAFCSNARISLRAVSWAMRRA